MNRGVCKGCGRAIIWINTKGLKPMPCDPEKVQYWQIPGGSKKIVTEDGRVISAETDGGMTEPSGSGYISHFATCPNAEYFRKR